MKFSERWLREWINPKISVEALCNQLTMAGLEVAKVKSVSGVFCGVKIGEIVKCMQHRNADKLRMTKVNIGGDHLLDIVCGAKNCRSGLRVAVATVGAILPGNFKIKAIKLRGELSQGMLCSFTELGILNAHNGIIELSQDAPIGTDIRDYLQLYDNIIEMNVTPNRADCLAIIGIARDISALNKMTFAVPKISPVIATINTTLPIRVDASHGCPRYLGRVIQGISIKTITPLWMREKLRRSSIASINTVVDVMNYVLLELGQPMHAFDLKRIKGGIVVRMATEGETLTLLNGKKTQLNTDTLVIADHDKVLAIAGIFGGEFSRINNKTQDVLLECAFFRPTAIIGRARRYGLQTDASFRYERGVDPELQYQAMERATCLLIEICGGQAGPVIDVTNIITLPKRTTIQLRRKKLNRLLGYIVPSKQVSDILSRLGCQVIEQGDSWLVNAPSWRFDIKIEEDLIEEVARIYGYNNVPKVPVHADLVMLQHCEADLKLERVKTLLVDHGFYEAITYSFVDPKVQTLLHPDQETLILPHPISVDMSVMRLSLYTGLVSSVVYNQNRQQTRLRLFESGLCFKPDVTAHLGIRQDIMLAGITTGHTYDKHWDLVSQPVDFYDLKGEVESILELTGNVSGVQFREEANAALHPGQRAAIYLHGTRIGCIGVIHPELGRKLDLNGRTVVFELQWAKIASAILPQVKEISRFPENHRDISIVVPENVAVDDILAECKKVSINQIIGVNLFDVYCGRGIAKGYKGLAIHLILQDTAGTLKEAEIAATIAKCVESLRQRFQASLRD
ncbi:phenylalanine--tRNA ligase subunit beta [Candidatus Gillettellia adelgis]